MIIFSTGDYSVQALEGGKRAAGTIPTELGKLKDWKYVVFRKLHGDYMFFIIHLRLFFPSLPNISDTHGWYI